MHKNPAGRMSERFTRFTKINRDGSGRLPSNDALGGPPQPTRAQSAIEKFLFAFVGLLAVLAVLALWSAYDPKHRRVPNHIEEGLHGDRVNIVVFGIGGDRHPGGGKDMADAIMLVSLKPSTHQAAVISIPRDLWVRVGLYGTHRLSQAHAIGNQSGYPGAGPGLLCDTIEQLFGQPVHAFVRVDFAAFEEIIDKLGGIDVYCPHAFNDYLFHDGFPQGWLHLNGKRALAYARYRYINGADGTNFARERRQQQIIDAVRDKLRNTGSDSAGRLIGALSALSSHTETNLTATQMWTLYRTFGDVDPKSVEHISLQRFTEVFPVTRFVDPGDAVRPRTGDFNEIRRLTRDVFQSQSMLRANEQSMTMAR